MPGREYRVLAIGDAHDSPHIPDQSRFKWIGKYAARNEIPYIVQIGDWATLDSCSQYDSYGSVEGRIKPSYDDDIESLRSSIKLLVDQFPKKYRPTCRITWGNHERRAVQWENDHPEVEGMFTSRLKNAFAEGGFKSTMYGLWHFIGGVGFTHFPHTIMGKPYGGKDPENQIKNDSVFSMVFAHTHKRKSVTVPKLGPGRRITLLNLGSALPSDHVERYALTSLRGWSYGIYDITIRDKDIQSETYINMTDLERQYG